MNSKPFILFLYATALFFIVREWYNRGNSGIPDPRILAPPTYLYAGLDIASGFTGNLTVPLAAALTVMLVWQAKGVSNSNTQTITPGANGYVPSQASSVTTTRKATV